MKKGYHWFNIYTKAIMPIFIIWNLISSLSAYSQIDFNGSLINITVLVIDLIYLVFSLFTLICISSKKDFSINLLCTLFVFNWFYRTFAATLSYYNTSQSETIILSALIYFVIFSIYYIPNIIYFYKRNDFFINNTEDDLYYIECKVCGKSILYNENETCDKCHKEILNRLSKKQDNKDNIIEESNLSDSAKNKLKKEKDFLSKKDLVDIIQETSNNKLFCTSCGKEIQRKWNFCNYCGNKLKE